jgi:uncharacterized membrane protein YtjA (UPF0391 family)
LDRFEVMPVLYWATIFLVIAIITAALGFGGTTVAAAGAPRFLFIVFLLLFVVSLLGGAAKWR